MGFWIKSKKKNKYNWGKTHPLLLLASDEEEGVGPVLAALFCRARMRVSIDSFRTSFVTWARKYSSVLWLCEVNLIKTVSNLPVLINTFRLPREQ